MQNFRNLVVWQKAHELTLGLYKNTASFPAEERFGLTSQIRRCSASIAANIAEGCGRHGDGEFHRFLQMAMGSASELEYHLPFAYDLGFLIKTKYQLLEATVIEIKRMLGSLVMRVNTAQSQAKSAGA
jgi:four helix bundle protein